jgi:hypothetical protein
MEPIVTLSSGLAAFRSTWDIARGAIAARDEHKIAEATQDLNVKILDVQNAALNLQEKASTMRDEIEALKNDKRELNARIAELERKTQERAEYALKEIHEGTFVLAYQKADDNAAPPHYICQPCMDNSAKKVVLQRQKRSGRVNLVCHVCNAVVFTGETYTMKVDVGAFR